MNAPPIYHHIDRVAEIPIGKALDPDALLGNLSAGSELANREAVQAREAKRHRQTLMCAVKRGDFDSNPLDCVQESQSRIEEP